MITAKNYAAQAEVGLIKHIHYLTTEESERVADIGYVKEVLMYLHSAVKFAMPDNGMVLDDGLKGIVGYEVRLPYPSITLEYYCSDDYPKKISSVPKCPPNSSELAHRMSNSNSMANKCVLVCIDNPDLDFIEIFRVLPVGEYWKVGIFCTALPKVGHTEIAKGGGTTVTSNTRGFYEAVMKQKNPDKYVIDMGRSMSLSDAWVVLEFLEALTCTNIEQSIYQPASPKNAQRIKSHKAPIYETRCLTLKTTKKESFGGGDGASSHKSPKQHLRRGHIRRLEKGNIWVNSCVVGDASNGIIDKCYKIKK